MKKNIVLVGALLIVGTTHAFAQQEKQIEEVTIASKTKESLKKSGKNVFVITETDLEKYKGQTLTEILQNVAGFQITGNYNNTSENKTYRIRGGNNSNVLILLDGVPLKDVSAPTATVADPRLLSTDNIESIEILNGASSVIYGSNAAVSVIDIKTKKNTNEKIKGNIGLKYASYDTFGQNLGILGNVEGFVYQVNASNEKSSGISAAKGNHSFDKDGFEKQNINALIGYRKGNVDFNINGAWNHHLYHYDYNSFQDSKNRGNDTQYLIGGHVNIKYNTGSITANARYSENKRDLQDLISNSYLSQYNYNGKNTSVEIFNQTKINKNISFVIGAQYEDQRMGSKNVPWGGTSLVQVAKTSDTKYNAVDGFAQINFNYEGFNLSTGTRLNHHSKYKNNWVYSINPYYLFDFNGNTLKLGYSYATAFISPTLFQVYGSAYVQPNFDLKPERNATHEIDLAFYNKDNSLKITTSLFQREEKDAIAYFVNKYDNVSQNKAKGFETGFEYRINQYFGVGSNFSFVEKDNAETMYRQPKQRWNSHIDIYPYKTTKITLSKAFVSKRTDYYYDALFARHNVELSDFTLFNININQKIAKNLDTYLTVNNILNKDYIDIIGYTTKNRNFILGLQYQF